MTKELEYHISKVVKKCKDWRETDKRLMRTPMHMKEHAERIHDTSVKNLREAVDQLTKREGQ